MEPLVIDDFIPPLYQDSIYFLLTGDEFPWKFYDFSVSVSGEDGSYEKL